MLLQHYGSLVMVHCLHVTLKLQATEDSGLREPYRVNLHSLNRCYRGPALQMQAWTVYFATVRSIQHDQV